MRDPSRVCNLQHSSWQRWILYPLSGARDQTHVLMDTSQVHYLLSLNENSHRSFVFKRTLYFSARLALMALGVVSTPPWALSVWFRGKNHFLLLLPLPRSFSSSSFFSFFPSSSSSFFFLFLFLFMPVPLPPFLLLHLILHWSSLRVCRLVCWRTCIQRVGTLRLIARKQCLFVPALAQQIHIQRLSPGAQQGTAFIYLSLVSLLPFGPFVFLIG